MKQRFSTTKPSDHSVLHNDVGIFHRCIVPRAHCSTEPCIHHSHWQGKRGWFTYNLVDHAARVWSPLHTAANTCNGPWRFPAENEMRAGLVADTRESLSLLHLFTMIGLGQILVFAFVCLLSTHDNLLSGTIFFCSLLLECDLLAKKVPGRAPFSQHNIFRNWT